MVLGNALRRRRAARGLKQEEVARHLGASPSKVSRIENGQHQFKEDDLGRFFTVYGIEDPYEQGQLRALAEGANQPTWWQPWSGVAQKSLQAAVSFEDMAQRIRSYEPLHLYGLLQTPDYARALIGRGEDDARRLDALVELREERRARFADAGGDKRLMCVIDEATLLRPVGSPEIMRGQLDHLAELAQNPRYQFRLAELGRYDQPVELGSTTLYDFSGRVLPTIVYAEGFEGGLVIQDEESVDRRKKAFDALLVSALGPRQTARRIRDLARAHYR
ncbi:helix-turn-helix transcriptional regulator [Streptomyces sp. J2-1]|nr:helix-turn-helix transcriptional regulator [Streptomyces corallincola]